MTLTVNLVADVGSWRPAGESGAAMEIAAFGEEGGGLSIPGPLIRVREGTTVALTLRNALASELHVMGLCGRPGPCDPVALPAGSTRAWRFDLNTPGTYYYWAAAPGRPLAVNSRLPAYSQLGGAIVVDSRDGAASDRVMVMSVLEQRPSEGPCMPNNAGAVFAINGLTWPHTERLRYAVGEKTRWRVVNLSCDQHAMHLHGFHFTVDATGDGTVDRALPPALRRTVVTEPIAPGRTFAMSWTPSRGGNWLFHCHMVVHMSGAPHGAHADAAAGMAGLVMGIEVPEASAAAPVPDPPARRFRMVLTEDAKRYPNGPGYRVDFEGIDAPRVDAGPVPGPVLVLRRGEPVEVTIINRMSAATAIHWHGLEIDSYFDGVPGFGGRAGRLAPAIAPGQSFVAKLNPPRAGTFIYHTHWHDETQLAGGLYGPLIVLDEGERYDPSVDHVAVIGLNGVLTRGEREPFALNGRSTPAPIRLRAGVPNRLRLINITANNVALTAFLVDQFEAVAWKPVSKDGAALPPEQMQTRSARQQVAVGETFDFEITPPRPQNLWLEVRRGNGEWVMQAPVEVR